MKYLKLYEDMNQPSTTKKKLRLAELGLADGLKVLSVTIHWDSLDDFLEAKNKEHWVSRGYAFFTFYDYENWPASEKNLAWQESLDDHWSDWKEWFGQEGDSDEIFDHLIGAAREGSYDLLHLRGEGQFYDPYTRELVGTGSMANPKLNESEFGSKAFANNSRTLAATVEEAIDKFTKWARLADLGLADRFTIVQIETQSDGEDPDLGFPAWIDPVKFREFKKFVKQFGVVHTNSYSGRSKADTTISAHLWEMPIWSMMAFSKLPELRNSDFSPIKSYKDPSDRIWNPWYTAITGRDLVNESNNFAQKLRLLKLGLVDPTEFEINKMSVVIDGPISKLRRGRLTYKTVLKRIYGELKERAKELGVYLTMFYEYSLRYNDPINHVQFYCVGPVESLDLLEPEINAKLEELNQNGEININVTNRAMYTGATHPTSIFDNWVKWAETDLFDS